MIKRPAFQDIKHFSERIETNELFRQYSNETFGFYYDSNFIELFFNPTVAEFLLLEKLQKEDQEAAGQNHLKFHWPADTGLYVEVLEYLSQENYEIGKLELLHLVPEQFIKRQSNPAVKILEVAVETLEPFLALNYIEDKEISTDFAAAKQELYRYQYKCPNVKFLLAFINQEPAGSLLVFSSENYLEVDNVLTAASWRKKGIATEMLDDVRKKARALEKEVILVADAEDTPREMYVKQGFQVVASQIHALKEF